MALVEDVPDLKLGVMMAPEPPAADEEDGTSPLSLVALDCVQRVVRVSERQVTQVPEMFSPRDFADFGGFADEEDEDVLEPQQGSTDHDHGYPQYGYAHHGHAEGQTGGPGDVYPGGFSEGGFSEGGFTGFAADAEDLRDGLQAFPGSGDLSRGLSGPLSPSGVSPNRSRCSSLSPPETPRLVRQTSQKLLDTGVLVELPVEAVPPPPARPQANLHAVDARLGVETRRPGGAVAVAVSLDTRPLPAAPAGRPLALHVPVEIGDVALPSAQLMPVEVPVEISSVAACTAAFSTSASASTSTPTASAAAPSASSASSSSWGQRAAQGGHPGAWSATAPAVQPSHVAHSPQPAFQEQVVPISVVPDWSHTSITGVQAIPVQHPQATAAGHATLAVPGPIHTTATTALAQPPALPASLAVVAAPAAPNTCGQLCAQTPVATALQVTATGLVPCLSTAVATVSNVPTQLQIRTQAQEALDQMLTESLPMLHHQGDLQRSYERYVEANRLHSSLYGRPSPDAFYNMACCLALGVGEDSQMAGAKLPPILPAASAAELAEARLDLAVSTLQSAVVAGFSNVPKLLMECSLQVVRERRAEQFAAVMRRLQGDSYVPVVAAATPVVDAIVAVGEVEGDAAATKSRSGSKDSAASVDVAVGVVARAKRAEDEEEDDAEAEATGETSSQEDGDEEEDEDEEDEEGSGEEDEGHRASIFEAQSWQDFADSFKQAFGWGW